MSLVAETRHCSRFFSRGVRRLLSQSGPDISHQAENEGAMLPAVAASAPSMFQEARNTNIHNATFNIYGTTSHSPFPSEESDTQTQSFPMSVQNTSLTTPLSHSTPLLNPSPPTQTSAEIYTRSLICHNLGYPLWIPSPNMRLPLAYRASGVCIGDVGIITPEGGFSFFFNVCQEATHPINNSRPLPPDFIPFSTSAGDWVVDEFKEFYAGSSLSTSSVSRFEVPYEAAFKPVFKTSATQAAVLMMPEPVYATKLVNKNLLTKYVNENLKTWYRFIKTVLGRDIENGDLRVVYGCRKSSAFGMATIDNGGIYPQTHTELTFSIDHSWAATTGCKFRWHCQGCAEAKAGPSLDEKEDIFAFNGHARDPINQSLFVSTIDLKLSEEEWQYIECGHLVAVSDQGLTSQAISPSSASLSRYDNQSDRNHSAISDSGKQARRVLLQPQHLSAEFIKHEDQPYPVACKNPSDILADYLLLVEPDATSVAVCTDDWGPHFIDSAMSASTLINSVLSKNEVCSGNGMAYFVPKDPMLGNEPTLGSAGIGETAGNLQTEKMQVSLFDLPKVYPSQKQTVLVPGNTTNWPQPTENHPLTTTFPLHPPQRLRATPSPTNSNRRRRSRSKDLDNDDVLVGASNINEGSTGRAMGTRYTGAEKLANTRKEAIRRQRIEAEQRRRDELREGYARLEDVLPSSNQANSKVTEMAENKAGVGSSSTYASQSEGGKRKKVKRAQTLAEQSVCLTCGRTDSTEWRRGPGGPRTLCNACGLRYAKRKRDEESRSARLPIA